MITLFGWGPMFDCPSPSPYVMKSDIQLQMLGVDFDRAIADLDAVPKHKAPYVMDGDRSMTASAMTIARPRGPSSVWRKIISTACWLWSAG